MRIDFTWWQLLLISFVVMSLIWLLVFSLSKSNLNVKTHDPATKGEKMLFALFAGLVSGTLLAYSLCALLPTYSILDSNHDHHTRYVLSSSTFPEEIFRIYVENKTGKTVKLGFVEYGNSDYESWPLADGQKRAIKKEPDYFFDTPPARKKIKLLDLGIHRAYYVTSADTDFGDIF